jgi:hypothetical protein
LSLAQLRQGKTSTSWFSEQKAKTKGGLRLRQTILSGLNDSLVLFIGRSIYKDFRGALVFRVIIFRKEELGQTDFLLSSCHLGHRSPRGTRKQIGFQRRKVFILSTTTSLDTIFQVNQEGQVSNTAIVVSRAIQDLEAWSRQGRLVKGLRRAKLSYVNARK